MSVKEFSFSKTDLESNKAQFLDGLTILSNQKDVAVCFQDDSLSNFFMYLNEFIQENYYGDQEQAICEFFLQNNFHLQLIRLNEYFAQNIEKLKPANMTTNSKDRLSSVFSDLQKVTNFFFAYSGGFRMNYLENGGLKYLLAFIKNEVCFNLFLNNQDYSIKKVVLNVSVLSTTCETRKTEWIELDAVNILLNCAKKSDDLKSPAYTAVVRAMTDTQIENLQETNNIIKIFIEPLKSAAQVIDEQGVNLKRGKLHYSDDDNGFKPYDVYLIPEQNDPSQRHALTKFLDVFYRLAVNDKIKYDLFVKHNVKDPLRIILFKGSVIERDFGFKLLAQLCFDPQVRDIVSKDHELISHIQASSTNTANTKSSIKSCKQILWYLAQENKNKSNLIKNQIMISYNSLSRDLCLKIKNELENAGYKIWIDINEIHGSSLESMASAVETSEIILICITENYRQSNNCQAEAQYAFKLKKTIIPLVLQKGYENVGGWLGMIMGDKIHINFIKYSFDESIKKLLNQISLTKPNIQQQTVIPLESKPALLGAEKKLNSVAQWTEEEVHEWFKTNDNLPIYEHLKPCDGRLLNQLYKMKLEAPEFFYQFISMKNQVENRVILTFTTNFMELFERNQ